MRWAQGDFVLTVNDGQGDTLVKLKRGSRVDEVLRFCIVGGVCFVVDFGLLFALTEWAGIHYLWSAAISFTVAVSLNYWLCLKFVFFNAPRQTVRQAVLFIVTSAVGVLLNQFTMWLLVNFFAAHYLASKIIATAVVTVWNYVTKRRAVKG